MREKKIMILSYSVGTLEKQTEKKNVGKKLVNRKRAIDTTDKVHKLSSLVTFLVSFYRKKVTEKKVDH